MFIVQLAAAIGIFSILMGFGAEKAIQYTQSRLPYNTAQRVVQATNFVGNAANSYYNQNCTSGTCPSGLTYPRVQDLVTAGYLPSSNGYSSCNCYTTKDGSRIQLVSGAAAGTFGMTITPGAMLASKPAYTSMLVSRIPGSSLSGNTIAVSQPVPALANLGGQFVKVNPAGTQSGDADLSGTLTTNSGINTYGPVNTNGQPVNTGQINTSNGEPINLTGNHGVCVTISQPPGEGQSTFGSYPLNTCLPMGQMVWPFGYMRNASFEWTGILVNGEAEVLQNQGYNNNCGGCDWFYTGFIVLAPVYSAW